MQSIGNPLAGKLKGFRRECFERDQTVSCLLEMKNARLHYGESSFVSALCLPAELRHLRDWVPQQYWLDHLKPFAGKEIIFVCGDSHIESFAGFLGSQGIPSTVVKREIGMTAELKKQADSELQYAKMHRDRIEEIYQEILEDNDGTIPPPNYPGIK